MRKRLELRRRGRVRAAIRKYNHKDHKDQKNTTPKSRIVQ